MSGKCDNVSLISSQVDLLLAEYDRGVGHELPVDVSAALEVRHASIHERDSTVQILATLHLVSAYTRNAYISDVVEHKYHGM